MKEFLNRYGGPLRWTTVFDKIHITSDLHLAHDKIKDFEPIRGKLQEAASFDGTPDEFLIRTWNEQVGKNDLVINLGDLHWKSYEPFAEQLNGVQLLILGNHDSKPQYYYKFDRVYPVEGVWDLDGIPSKLHLDTERVGNDKLLSALIYNDVMFSHYPIYNIKHEYNYQRGGRIIERMMLLGDIAAFYDDLKNVHGHMHSACPEGTKNSINVCYDFNKYKLLDFWETLYEAKDLR